eukprot:508972_1
MFFMFLVLLANFITFGAAKYEYPKKYAIESFITTYYSTDNDITYNITGYQPSTTNPDGYPLHVFVQGTHSDPLSSWSLTVQRYTQYMAERGVISASIWYNNAQYPPTCIGFQNKAESMFSFNNAQSALSVLCNSPSLNIDCNKGIVAHGISQGAQLVLLSGVYAGSDMITAINPLAGGTTFVGNCLNYENLNLHQSKIRSRVGINDGIFCTGAESCRNSQTTITGYSCPNQLQCMQNDGSGWYVIQTSETASGAAEHCYMFLNSECQDAFDANYYPSCENCDWSLQADLGWLIGRLYPDRYY